MKGIVDEIDRVEMAAVEAMEAQEAVSAPGGLLDQFRRDQRAGIDGTVSGHGGV